MTDKEEKKAPETPQWEHKTEFEINKRMKEVIKLTISATEAELDGLRRKLEKMQYGS